jgi:hypothetical protein
MNADLGGYERIRNRAGKVDFRVGEFVSDRVDGVVRV